MLFLAPRAVGAAAVEARAMPAMATVAVVEAPETAGQEGGDVPGPGALLEADLTATAGSGGLVVEVSYRLRPPAGATAIPVEALPLPARDGRPGPWSPRGLTARLWEDPVALELTATPSGMLRGEVALPEAATAGDVVQLRLRYRLSGGDGEGGPRRIVVPVLTVPWPPEEALPGVFTVRAALAPEQRVVDGFPALWAPERDAGGEIVPGRYRAELPVLTSVVVFSVRRDGDGPTLPDVLTAGVLLLLAALLAAGAVAFRRSGR